MVLLLSTGFSTDSHLHLHKMVSGLKLLYNYHRELKSYFHVTKYRCFGLQFGVLEGLVLVCVMCFECVSCFVFLKVFVQVCERESVCLWFPAQGMYLCVCLCTHRPDGDIPLN